MSNQFWVLINKHEKSHDILSINFIEKDKQNRNNYTQIHEDQLHMLHSVTMFYTDV